MNLSELTLMAADVVAATQRKLPAELRTLARDVPVAWELSLPATDKGGPRAALVGQASAKVGQSMLEVPLAFRPSDPLGAWHAKVTADSLVVIDRDFTVIAPPPPPKSAPKPLVPRSPNPSAPDPSAPPQ